MENANTALMIAGGILIAILIIATLVYMIGKMSSVVQEQSTVKVVEQVAEYNRVYEAYEKKKVRGTEIITLTNRARDNNKKYENNPKMQIKVLVKITKGYRGYGTVHSDVNETIADDGLILDTVYDFTAYTNAAVEKILSTSKDEGHAFMYARFFQCTDIEYDNEGGRVSSIIFTEI